MRKIGLIFGIMFLLIPIAGHATIVVKSGNYKVLAIVVLSRNVPTALFNPGTRSELRLALTGPQAARLKRSFGENDLAKSFDLNLRIDRAVAERKGAADLLGFSALDVDVIPPQVGNNLKPL